MPAIQGTVCTCLDNRIYYNWHRFYDPETGRYISADPIGLAGGMNLYAYVGGDPVNAVDINGLSNQQGVCATSFCIEKLRRKGSNNDTGRQES